MEILIQTPDVTTFIYDNAAERNAHINCYGRDHVLTNIKGDGTTTALSATFNNELRTD